MNELDNMRQALKKFFADRGLSQNKIAELVGTSQQTVCGLLNNRNFGKRTAMKWSEQFGLNPAWLITGEGEMMLADKERAQQKMPDTYEAEQGITSKKIVDLGVNAVATQILQLVENGDLYTKKHVQNLEAKITELQKEINDLNREIGSLRTQLNQCNAPATKTKEA